MSGAGPGAPGAGGGSRGARRGGNGAGAGHWGAGITHTFTGAGPGWAPGWRRQLHCSQPPLLPPRDHADITILPGVSGCPTAHRHAEVMRWARPGKCTRRPSIVVVLVRGHRMADAWQDVFRAGFGLAAGVGPGAVAVVVSGRTVREAEPLLPLGASIMVVSRAAGSRIDSCPCRQPGRIDPLVDSSLRAAGRVGLRSGRAELRQMTARTFGLPGLERLLNRRCARFRRRRFSSNRFAGAMSTAGAEREAARRRRLLDTASTESEMLWHSDYTYRREL